MKTVGLLFVLALAACDAFSIKQKRQEVGCTLGSMNYNVGEEVKEGTIICTCIGGGDWDCADENGQEWEEPKKSCYSGPISRKHGEAWSEGGVTCTCDDGDWVCV